MTLEPHTFNSNETLTLAIAAYAALVSTFVLGWVAYKWLAPRDGYLLWFCTPRTAVAGRACV